jgi:hypothetical protein
MVYGLWLFSVCKTEVAFLGGICVFLRFSQGFFSVVFFASKICFWETLIGRENGEPMKAPRISQKNENTIFTPGNQNAKIGYQIRKTPVFPQPQLCK